MGSRGALGEPATVLSPSLVTSVAHPCPPSSHKDGQHRLMWLRHGWEKPGLTRGGLGREGVLANHARGGTQALGAAAPQEPGPI